MENNTKKKKKFNLFGFLGIMMILAGLGIIIYDVGSSYLEREALKRELQDFLNAPLPQDDSDGPSKQETDKWGSIEIEKLDINHLIVKSDDWGYLNRYVVAWNRSIDPPGEGNFSIAGHNGRCASCVFRDFEKIEKGDTIKLHRKEDNTTYIYKVYDNFEVPYTDTSVLNDDESRGATLTLVTCTEANDYSVNRTIIKAELESSEPTR
ncbi:sortase [Erysipelothrix rhusiopathiae]|uniref:Sortase family protein n=2 Tax=Erysipelothrix TaxID=1647 RepID=E7FX36_ERYRH|nr:MULTISPECIES: sortase [Erysipelothrix]CAH2760677.1 sortase [Erysipelothrix sp. A18Y020d]AGN25012.1 sortase family protein [Erysipelothrix rhusiopathiae SY1027]AMS10263.1 sortase [Erysipelothrix rhusiopathiae]AOO67395.1 sortase [Erysipelothrix rhusiopathiae]AWU40700.1 sortase [Erysipelothrix rhusiopathiae]